MNQKTLVCQDCGYKIVIFEHCVDIKLCPECEFDKINCVNNNHIILFDAKFINTDDTRPCLQL